MDIGSAEVDLVVIPEGHRPVDQAKVDELAESMAAIGLQQPISVWSPDNDTLELVAGRHRDEPAGSDGPHPGLPQGHGPGSRRDHPP